MIHAALVAVMGWLAIALILPAETFRRSQSFALMAELADENQWAILFWLVATIGVAGLTTRNGWLRMIAVLVVATMHGVLALFLMLGNPVTTGTGTYGIIALLGYYVAWRRAGEGL